MKNDDVCNFILHLTLIFCLLDSSTFVDAPCCILIRMRLVRYLRPYISATED